MNPPEKTYPFDFIIILMSKQLSKSFFKRLSTPINLLVDPGPNDEEIEHAISISKDVPDHGNLKPWNIAIYKKTEQINLSKLRRAIFIENNPQSTDSQIEAEFLKFQRTPLLLVVTSKVVIDNPKIPIIEQYLSGGALCQNLLLAFNQLGYGAKWVTGWPSRSKSFLDFFQLKNEDIVLGFIHIGTPEKLIYREK
jgi:nitroreductase